MDFTKAGLDPLLLSICTPRSREDALLSAALRAHAEGRSGEALLAAEAVCRRHPDRVDPAMLRAKLLDACLPAAAGRAWLHAWRCAPENPLLQDALLGNWLASGAAAMVASLGQTFLPGRCQRGQHDGLLRLLTAAGVGATGACWKSGDVIEGRLFIGPQARATLQLSDEAQAWRVQVSADGSLFRVTCPYPAGVWSVALEQDGQAPRLLAGSPLAFYPPPQTTLAAPGQPDPAGVAIIVPVYRDLAQVRACIDSVLASLPLNRTAAELVVIDDASPEAALGAWLDDMAAQGRLTLLRNRFNLGFIETCNRGMRLRPRLHAMLLNADTLVHGDWLDRLAAALAHDPEAGSVSPWSNNGEISSFPLAGAAAPPMTGAELAAIDGLAAQIAAAPVELPSCCGFAMLMRRAAIDQAGTLDGASLVRGYGEEVDWCLRARAAGFRHFAVPSVFIAHSGGASFGLEKHLRVFQNRQVLQARYPDYRAAYHQFLRDDPLRAARHALRAALGQQANPWLDKVIAGGEQTGAGLPALLPASPPGTCERIVVWDHAPDSCAAPAVLALARLLATHPGYRCRLLVMGAASEALWRTGVVDVLRPLSHQRAPVLSDLTMLGLSGCQVVLSDGRAAVPQGLAHVHIDGRFDAGAWLRQWRGAATEEDGMARDSERAGAGPAPPRWHGALEGMHKNLLFGWALDGAKPQERVVLEVCLDGNVIGCVVADCARSDLYPALRALGAGDNCHGFVADLGQSQTPLDGVLSVRVANLDITLAGACKPADAPDAPAAASSLVYADGGLRLHGWAFDPANPAVALDVHAYRDHEWLASAPANQRVPGTRWFDVGAHGFTLDLPLSLADGRMHSIRVIDSLGRVVNGGPISLCHFAAGLHALLPAPRPPLLGELIDVYERYLPRSIALRHYPAWSAQFDTGPAPDGSPLRVGMLVAGGTTQARERSCASLAACSGVDLQVFAGEDFNTLLGAALAAGVDTLGALRPGDTLVAHALATALGGFGLAGAALVYSDSEYAGQPWFKPAWNPDYAYASDYPLELLLVRVGLARADAPDWPSLAWSAIAAAQADPGLAIVHVPHVLYRFHAPLDAAERHARDAAAGAALALLEPLARLSTLDIAPTVHQARRLSRPLTEAERALTVSLIIPTRDSAAMLGRCIDSIGRHTDWPNLELIVIDNGSVEPETARYFAQLGEQGVRVLPMPGPFNFADLNNRAVQAARGTLVGLVNNDIEALHPGWLDEMVGQLLRPGVGAVGAKLLWPNGMVQHGGVLLGVGNVAGHFGNRLADGDWGDHGRNQLVQQVSGVTAACLLLRRDDFLALGGMDGVAFPVAFNDVDLCLKLRQSGKAIVWTPHARLLHAESASRGHEDTPQKRARAQREVDLLRERWGPVLLRDPAYHPSLNLDAHSHAFGGLALPPRPRHPRLGALAIDPPVLLEPT